MQCSEILISNNIIKKSEQFLNCICVKKWKKWNEYSLQIYFSAFKFIIKSILSIYLKIFLNRKSILYILIYNN